MDAGKVIPAEGTESAFRTREKGQIRPRLVMESMALHRSVRLCTEPKSHKWICHVISRKTKGVLPILISAIPKCYFYHTRLTSKIPQSIMLNFFVLLISSVNLFKNTLNAIH